MSYEAARQFADTWGLVLLVILFVGMLVFIFRRGSSKKYQDAARIPMEVDETLPPESPASPDQKINDLKAASPHEAGAARKGEPS